MFGYIGENTTTHSARTNRPDVNKLGYLFGGEGVWLGNMLTFERILPRRASVRIAIRRHRTPRSPTDEKSVAVLPRLN
jgi:hypothetical protein